MFGLGGAFLAEVALHKLLGQLCKDRLVEPNMPQLLQVLVQRWFLTDPLVQLLDIGSLSEEFELFLNALLVLIFGLNGAEVDQTPRTLTRLDEGQGCL